MEIIIKAEPKEIADLVSELQSQQIDIKKINVALGHEFSQFVRTANHDIGVKDHET